MKNTPYTRGCRKEPISKDKPYLNPFPSRSQRRAMTGRLFSNKKGTQLVVSKIGAMAFLKTFKRLQHFPKKTIVNMG